jgi:hypothetical protein
MDVNDDLGCRGERGVLTHIASVAIYAMRGVSNHE